ncbi:MAG: hypothetical protein K9J81_06915 [Desulfohalobiaceae bacterium]|nr:hypothetical protein [Desulfohalobiaceae bacterium]
MDEDGSTEPMEKIFCKNESLELQNILIKNHDLLPGDQINPSDPRRWLLVRREMPVPDPSTGGGGRWSIDVFLVDQDAIPTFIECKRYADTRARREVVGQMLEYAANGHYYWSKDEMLHFAEQAAAKKQLTLVDELNRLQMDDYDSEDVFFQRVEDNLREGQVRLVFFMEEAPPELKSLVDFLNKQMERSEVLLVEARQYEYRGMRIVNPILFGYTEEARKVKRAVTVSSGEKRPWDYESFFQVASEKLQEDQVELIRQIYKKSQELEAEITWGKGMVDGSFSIRWPHLGKNNIFAVFTNGLMAINFGNFKSSEKQIEFREFLKEKVTSDLNFTVPSNYENKYPNFSLDDLRPKLQEFFRLMEVISTEFSVNVSDTEQE